MLYGEIKTLDAVKTWVKSHGVNGNISYKEFNDWEDILIIGRDIIQEDILLSW